MKSVSSRKQKTLRRWSFLTLENESSKFCFVSFTGRSATFHLKNKSNHLVLQIYKVASVNPHVLQIRHPTNPTQCVSCPQGTVPDSLHIQCMEIPELYLLPDSGWAIGAMAFSSTGILITLFVCGVFVRFNDTPIVRASGRELSYVLLAGILMCYCVTYSLVLRPNDIVCGLQRYVFC